VEPSNPAPEAQRSARRRLVRGAFAAPAVLALYSGSAAAMASNLRCVYNRVDAGHRTFPGPADSQDRYVRVQLWSLRHNGSLQHNDKVRWFLSGDDFQALTVGSSVHNPFLGPGQWWQFDPATQSLLHDRLTSDPSWSNGLTGTLVRDGRWVAVRIDATSQGASIIGVVDSSKNHTGSAVSGLCWASFVTAAR